MKNFLICGFISLCILTSCKEELPKEIRNFQDIEKSLLTEFILAEDGDTIEIDKGQFLFKRSLILDNKKNMVIRGKGIDQTILSFKGQEEGAEGIKITNCTNIVIENLTVEDAAGDNIKVMETEGITFRNVKVSWTGGPKTTNGAYGLYPVICKNVLIEKCIATGASDAGIYVGQSDHVVIRENKIYKNVAGIESENSKYVDIYNNEARDNTGGILVFDLPALTQYGNHVRVFNNKIIENNHRNFAPPGNIVAVTPAGTGILVLATEKVEIFNNQIINNKTAGTAIISYHLINAISTEEESENEKNKESERGTTQKINRKFEEDKNYNPYSRAIYIHDNQYENKYWLPSLKSDFGKLFVWKFGFNTPDIIVDGIEDPDGKHDDGTIKADYSFCFQNNGNATFANLDAGNDFKNLHQDMSKYDCSRPPIKAVQLNPYPNLEKDEKSVDEENIEIKI
ncbi:parallel beta-helix domain-containing protein [Xanthovirga aplysinae]|uniref:parallel beta-helix domain-containing protein n=1 Tax=Xanthovirga aplysinae TaxID=2529853 RepID=UPI0012BCCF88|nr:parallel beta-helix domain-containing protein [Xanthovirga aplysinae]MTI31237.1 hypothetical protein [Xanthovirga aplysinae]